MTAAAVFCFVEYFLEGTYSKVQTRYAVIHFEKKKIDFVDEYCPFLEWIVLV